MYISGVGRTKFGNLSDNLQELAYEAILNALDDSNLDINEIGAIFVSNFLSGPLNGQLHLNSMISSLIPGINIPIIRVETACASSSVAFNQAIYCLQNYSNILIVGVEKMTGVGLLPTTDAISMAGDRTYDFPNGLIFPAAYALIAQQYMLKNNINHDILELVSYINHQNSRLNPLAHFYYKEVSKEMIKNAPMIASPLNLFDCSPISDGAVAVILSKNKTSDRDVKVMSSKIATDTISLTERINLTSFIATKIASKQAYKEAQITPADLDIIEIHDCFTISELIALEDLGICGASEVSELIKNGDILRDGPFPVNTDGGLKANGHPIGATGLAQIFEIVAQLRQETEKRQVDNPEIGLAQNIGGIGGTCGITILGV